MHNYVISQRKVFENKSGDEYRRELFVGNVIQAAIKIGLKNDTVVFKGGNYQDIGTPEDLLKAVRMNKALKEFKDNDDSERNEKGYP